MSSRYRVQWTEVATVDLEMIVDYVAATEEVGVADDLADRIAVAADEVATFPMKCRVVPELQAEGVNSYRELLVGPYRLFFAVRGDDVVVVAAVDGRRDLTDLLIQRAMWS